MLFEGNNFFLKRNHKSSVQFSISNEIGYFQQAMKLGFSYYMVNEERMVCTLSAFIQRSTASATSHLLPSVSVGLGELAYITLHPNLQILQVTVI